MDTIQVIPISELEEMMEEEAVCQTMHGSMPCGECRAWSQCAGSAQFIVVVPCCGHRRLKCAECLYWPYGWTCSICGVESEGFVGVRPV